MNIDKYSEVQKSNLGMRSEPFSSIGSWVFDEVKLTLSDEPDEPEPFWSESRLGKGSPFLFLQLVLLHFSCCHMSFERNVCG